MWLRWQADVVCFMHNVLLFDKEYKCVSRELPRRDETRRRRRQGRVPLPSTQCPGSRAGGARQVNIGAGPCAKHRYSLQLPAREHAEFLFRAPVTCRSLYRSGLPLTVDSAPC